jgi:hypothetical protein
VYLVINGYETEMAGTYHVEFESSYFSNGWLLICLVCVSIGLGVVIAAVIGRLRLKERGGCGIAFIALWCTFWLSFSLWWLVNTVITGWNYTTALRDGRCKIIEGTVEVLYEQPYSGHAPGDRIRIDGQEFQFSYYTAALSYSRTIAHGGVLRDGTKARLHYLDGAILKVEIAP